MNFFTKPILFFLFSLIFGCASFQGNGDTLSKDDVAKIAKQHNIGSVAYYKEYKGRDKTFLYIYSNLRDQPYSGWCLSDYTFIEVDPRDLKKTSRGDTTTLASTRTCASSEQKSFFPASGIYVDSLIALAIQDIERLNNGLISNDEIKCIDDAGSGQCSNRILLDINLIQSIVFRSGEELKINFYKADSSYTSVVFLYKEGKLEKITFEPEI